MENDREKLILETEVARNLAYDDYDEEIYEIIQNEQVDSTRWSSVHELVIQTKVDGRFWKTTYTKGLTESQDESPFEYSKPEFTEVFPEIIEITVYN